MQPRIPPWSIHRHTSKDSKYKLGSIYARDYLSIDKIGSQVNNLVYDKYLDDQKLEVYKEVYKLNKPISRFLKGSPQKDYQLFMEKGHNEEESSQIRE